MAASRSPSAVGSTTSFTRTARDRSGPVPALAVAAPSRLPELQDVPTFRELGAPPYELRIWTGLLAPAGTPKEIVARLNEAVRAILSSAEMRKEIADEGGEAGSTTADDFTAFLRGERERWSALVEASGIPRI